MTALYILAGATFARSIVKTALFLPRDAFIDWGVAFIFLIAAELLRYFLP